MDLNETRKVISIIAKNYPKFYNDYKPQDFDIVASTWQAVLKDIAYKDVGSALVEYILSLIHI